MDLSASLSANEEENCNARDFIAISAFFNNADNSLGFGLKRRGRPTKFYPKLFVDVRFEDGPIHFGFSFRFS